MNIKEIFSKLNEKEPFDIEEASIEELSQILAHPNYMLVKNLSSLIKQHYFKADQSFLKDLSIRVKENSLFRENLIMALEIPEKISKDFEYTQYKLISKEDFPIYSDYKLTYETEKALPSLYHTGEAQSLLKINFLLEPDSLFSYQELPESSLEQNLFDKFVSNNQDVIKAVASMTAGALVVGTFLFGAKAHARMDIGPEKVQVKVNQETLKFLNINKDLSDVIKIFENSKDKHDEQIVNILNSISAEELQKITNLKKEEIVGVSEEQEIQTLCEAILDIYRSTNPKQYNQLKPKVEKIVKAVFNESKKRNLDRHLLLSIIRTESDFSQSFVSTTEDYSLAQINVEQWDKEFARLKRDPINKDKIKKDSEYAISRMAEILEILNDRHSKDPLWYARYHSSTPSRKIAYAEKINNNLNYFSSFELKQIKDKLDNAIFLVSSLKTDENREAVNQLIHKLSLLSQHAEEYINNNSDDTMIASN